MEQLNPKDPGLNRRSPWGHKRVGRYSLEEIALEFILWEDEEGHSETVRKNFIVQALEQSFGNEDRHRMLSQFVDIYGRLYEKIYQRNQGNIRKPDRATPESMRRVLEPMMMKTAA